MIPAQARITMPNLNIPLRPLLRCSLSTLAVSGAHPSQLVVAFHFGSTP